jgi:hypothetical protein
VSILCFNWSNTILAAPRQQLLERANGNGDSDGQQRWQLQWWTTLRLLIILLPFFAAKNLYFVVTETAMARARARAKATATAFADGNATETAAAMVDGNRNDNG